uniref:Hsp70-Hsp90 organising protein n=1 Tax=Babesia bovis TaxID=5865 RepID=S6B3H5_BABBO|nr:tetratricopeptide repeat domain containing protein [Babesia bovis]
MADHKQLGNEAFKAGRFLDAVQHFTAAIQANPSDGILYSNRSGAYASLQRFQEALDDANQCVSLKPDWPKGYSRKGLALYKLGRLQEARTAYQEGLKIDPANEPLMSGLREVESASDPEFMYLSAAMSQLVATNPKLQQYQQQDPSYVMNLCRMISGLKTNPQSLQHVMMDPNPAIREGIMAYIQMASGMPQPEETPEPPQPKQPEKKEEPKPKEEPLSEDQQKAKEYKEEGNKLYKQKRFEEALEMYKKAIEHDPDNLLLENNKAAVYLEMGDYAKCIATCNAAIDRRYEVKADFLVISKIQAMSQSGTVDEEQYRQAMADPEVQQMLGDPQFQIILKRLSENPAAMNEYLSDPKIAKGIQKLMACGILRTA